MMPLGLLTSGECAEITDIMVRKDCEMARSSGNGCGSMQSRIEDIGIRAGKNVEMLNNEGRGPLLVKIDESRIAISRGMAMKILVRRKDNGSIKA